MNMHTTTNYGLAGGTCDASAHLRRALEQVEQQIAELKKDDPTMYYDGDFAELLDTRKRLTERLKGPIA